MSEFTPTTEHVQRNYVGAEESYSVGTHRTRAARRAEFDRWLATVRAEAQAEGAARALRDYADEVDRRAADYEAGRRVDGVRCARCDLRHEERQQYSCAIEGRGHEYDELELADAATFNVEPTYEGGRLRARADQIEAEAKP